MKFNEALGTAIRKVRTEKNLTLRAVCKKSFISMGHLSDVENGRKEGSSVFIEAIAKGLGVNTYELIIEAGYLMADFQVPDSAEGLLDVQLNHGLALQT